MYNRHVHVRACLLLSNLYFHMCVHASDHSLPFLRVSFLSPSSPPSLSPTLSLPLTLPPPHPPQDHPVGTEAVKEGKLSWCWRSGHHQYSCTSLWHMVVTCTCCVSNYGPLHVALWCFIYEWLVIIISWHVYLLHGSVLWSTEKLLQKYGDCRRSSDIVMIYMLRYYCNLS